MSMDAAYILEQFQQDLANVPEEVAHYLEEIKAKDVKLYTLRKRIQHYDNQIHKHIRTHGSLSENPKEKQYSNKISADFEHAIKMQQEKCELANKLNDLVSRHMRRLDLDIKRLQNDGLLAPSTDAIVLPATRALQMAASTSNAAAVANAQKRQPSQPIVQHLHAPLHSHPQVQPSRGATPDLAAAGITAGLNGLASGVGALPGTPQSGNNAVTSNGSIHAGQRPMKRQKLANGSSVNGSVRTTPSSVSINSPLSASMMPTPGKIEDDAVSAAIAVTTQLNRSGLVPRGSNGLGSGTVRAGSATTSNKIKSSSQQPADDDEEENNDSALYCFCQQVSYGDMIACDNPDCQYEWFHYGCVGLKAPPSGLWYCSAECEQVCSNKKGRK
ncbi:inhibitor of growth proteins N-terminal histone-binding-domain-containing protein [Dipodascopsis uninucleata]